MSACTPVPSGDPPLAGGSRASRPSSACVLLIGLVTALLISIGAVGQSHATTPVWSEHASEPGKPGTEPLEPGLGAASDTLTSPLLIYLPVSSRGHPVGVCRGTVSGERALALANNKAAFEGLGPPRGYRERFVRRAEMLTGAEHDTLYPDEPIVHRGLPAIEPWDCFWRIELDVYGMWTPSSPGSEPWLVNWFMSLVDARTGVVRTWAVAAAPPSPASAPPTSSPPTPRIHATGTPTPRPTSSATNSGHQPEAVWRGSGGPSRQPVSGSRC